MNRIMCHLVSHFPDRERAALVAESLADAGAAYLEIQFPFSDPAADGPLIQDACTRALAAGFTVSEGFRFIAEVTKRRPRVPIFLMTYGSLAVRRGVPDFVRLARDSGVRGLIVPDLPFDSDEGLFDEGRRSGVAVVPVLVPGMAAYRIEGIRALRPEFVYAALRHGITGSRTELGPENLAFLRGIAPWGSKIFAGFGINSRDQVDILMPEVEAAVVGSHFVGIIQKKTEAAPEELVRALRTAALELIG
jgi:tryptophan synthase alpha chain